MIIQLITKKLKYNYNRFLNDFVINIIFLSVASTIFSLALFVG